MDFRIILIYVLFLARESYEKSRVKICAVSGSRSKPGRVVKYCDLLSKSKKSRVSCVYGVDRLDCLRMVSHHDADFTYLQAEDLYVSTLWGESDVLVVSELRGLKEDLYKYGIVVVVRNDLNITSTDLRWRKLCHPGLKTDSEWNDLFSQYFEERLAPRNCEPNLTVFEDRAKTSAEYFGDSCKAGPWVEDNDEDVRLKLTYSSMCAICDEGDCSNREMYRGSAGSVLCIGYGVGDVLWGRYDFVMIFFKKFGDSGNGYVSQSGFSFLCEDGSLRPINDKDPCFWLAMPWQVIAANGKSTNEVQKIFHESGDKFGDEEWENNLIHVMEYRIHHVVNLQVPKTPEDYLKEIPGYLSAVETSQGNCKPDHSVRLCTTSPIQQKKCVWMSRASLPVALQPPLDCVERENITRCMECVYNGLCDVAVVPPDHLMDGKTKFGLEVVYYELPSKEDGGYALSGFVLPESSIKLTQDLKDKRACFTRVNGIGWNCALTVRESEKWKFGCGGKNVLMNVFKEACVMEPTEGVPLCCNATEFSGNAEFGTLHCLIQGKCDIAFLDNRTIRQYEDNSSRYGERMSLKLRKICLSPENCTWMWSFPNYLMINPHTTKVKIKEVKSLFSQLGNVFGRESKDDNEIFEMFAPFNGVNDVIFRDTSVNFAKNNKEFSVNNYEDVIDNLKFCSRCSTHATHGFLLVTSFVGFLLVSYL